MWKIDKDYLAEEGDISRVGYSEQHSRIPASMAVVGLKSGSLPTHYLLPPPGKKDKTELPVIRFRLKDGDGEVYYRGYLHDDDGCENQESALMWGANDAGAAIIEVLRDGKWVQEIG